MVFHATNCFEPKPVVFLKNSQLARNKQLDYFTLLLAEISAVKRKKKSRCSTSTTTLSFLRCKIRMTTAGNNAVDYFVVLWPQKIYLVEIGEPRLQARDKKKKERRGREREENMAPLSGAVHATSAKLVISQRSTTPPPHLRFHRSPCPFPE